MTCRSEIIADGVELYCGDCFDVVKDMGVFDHAIFDPPYESIMHAAKSENTRKLRTDRSAELKKLDFAPIDEIRQPIVDMLAEHCAGWAAIFCTPEGVGRWADSINASPIKYKRACGRVKPDSTPQLNGQGPAQGAENFVTAWCGRGYSKWNGGGKRGTYTHLTNPPDRHGIHPTEKPWRLMAEIISDFTAPGETIFDPFMGSGSTGVAAVRLGRKFVGIEKKPEYFDIACKRISAALKQKDLFIRTPEPMRIKQEAML